MAQVIMEIGLKTKCLEMYKIFIILLKIEKGEYQWTDGRKYIGAWKDNKMDGIGTYTWSDGRSYQGEYKDDKKEGFGIYKWADGRACECFWKEGKQDGGGKWINVDNNMKFGQWVNGVRQSWLEDPDTISELKKDLEQAKQKILNGLNC